MRRRAPRPRSRRPGRGRRRRRARGRPASPRPTRGRAPRGTRAARALDLLEGHRPEPRRVSDGRRLGPDASAADAGSDTLRDSAANSGAVSVVASAEPAARRVAARRRRRRATRARRRRPARARAHGAGGEVVARSVVRHAARSGGASDRLPRARLGVGQAQRLVDLDSSDGLMLGSAAEHAQRERRARAPAHAACAAVLSPTAISRERGTHARGRLADVHRLGRREDASAIDAVAATASARVMKRTGGSPGAQLQREAGARALDRRGTCRPGRSARGRSPPCAATGSVVAADREQRIGDEHDRGRRARGRRAAAS